MKKTIKAKVILAFILMISGTLMSVYAAKNFWYIWVGGGCIFISLNFFLDFILYAEEK